MSFFVKIAVKDIKSTPDVVKIVICLLVQADENECQENRKEK